MAEKQDKLWHALDSQHTLEALKTDSEQGLSSGEAKNRLDRYGKNELPEGKKTPVILKFLKHFNDVLIYILLAAAVVMAILGHFSDTVVIVIVAIVNATIGFMQEHRAEQALEGIKNMLSPEAQVRRDGNLTKIEAAEVVPGDIVLLSAGDKIPADLRMLSSDNLKVEESALTGESTSVEKQTGALEKEVTLGDRTNIVFSGTTVSSGTGTGVAVATGDQTEIGKINKSIASVEEQSTPLLKQTAHFGKMVSIVIVAVAALMFGFGYWLRDYEVGELLLSVIGLAVAAIPEGLPAILSIILAIGVQNMAKRKAIVRNLPSVETLGAVSVICSDKTGTLTKNEMTVTSVVTSSREYEVTGTGYAPEGEIRRDKEQEADPEEDRTLKHLLICGVTCNDSVLTKEDGKWALQGDPTEGCLLTLAGKAQSGVPELEITSKLPFDSEYKYMAVLTKDEGRPLIYVKGAPDRLFEMAGSQAEDDGVAPFNAGFWRDQMQAHARKGQRVIGLAMKELPEGASPDQVDHDDLKEGLVFLGLAGIVDPPRDEVGDAIRECKNAGIEVKMITGDHKETAMAIGKQLGIGDGEHSIEGRELDRMSKEELQEAARQYSIFARTSPQNKLQLVEALQSSGSICAMTGDGVNDAPALKRADVGVAMGIKGTEVSKDASEMVLADDNFSTIVQAVKEGRRVYDNLKKTILFILPTNGAESFLIMASILLGTVIPLTPIQILWVNMVSSVTVSLALAFERIEPGAMKRPPRNPAAPLLSKYYIFRILFVSVLLGGGTLAMSMSLLDNGYDQSVVNTVTMQTIVLAQMFHLFNCRTELEPAFGKGFFANKAVFVVSALLILFQLSITYLPFMNKVFGTVPIGLSYWSFPLMMGAAVFVIIEIEKTITRTIVRRRSAGNISGEGGVKNAASS
ncbi:cation-transporting P-type ATPase [Paenibacillus camerounensis]|uniref:cation-transporting P-type ATPase n=1 Tax=Paenibacillus camerounensis TaxID=1243663 RepID=UPI000A6F04FC|nr:cation-transporting P-type ATPase [Paenibacillus camerounensis]